MALTIYHNPRCSKSCETLALLHEQGHQPHVILYMDDGIDAARLADLIGRLATSPAAFIRRKEALFRTLDLDGADDDTLIRAMSKHPQLIERPIVVNGDRAALGRPPEAVLDLLP